MGIYLLTSLIFIVVCFIEFALVLILQQLNEKQVQKHKQLSKWRNYRNASAKLNETREDSVENGMHSNLTQATFNIGKIDIAGFVAFGGLYLLFNAIYWAIFLNITFD